jgi:hypothetical protein
VLDNYNQQRSTERDVAHAELARQGTLIGRSIGYDLVPLLSYEGEHIGNSIQYHPVLGIMVRVSFSKEKIVQPHMIFILD